MSRLVPPFRTHLRPDRTRTSPVQLYLCARIWRRIHTHHSLTHSISLSLSLSLTRTQNAFHFLPCDKPRLLPAPPRPVRRYVPLPRHIAAHRKQVAVSARARGVLERAANTAAADCTRAPNNNTQRSRENENKLAQSAVRELAARSASVAMRRR